jgi:hypothetical protein
MLRHLKPTGCGPWAFLMSRAPLGREYLDSAWLSGESLENFRSHSPTGQYKDSSFHATSCCA